MPRNRNPLNIDQLAVIHVFGNMFTSNHSKQSARGIFKGWNKNCTNFAASTCRRHVHITSIQDIDGRPFPRELLAETKEEMRGVEAYQFLLEWASGLKNLKGHNHVADNRVKGEFYDAFTKYSRKDNDLDRINASNLNPLIQALMRDASNVLNLWSNPEASRGRNPAELLQASLNSCANIARDREAGQVPKYDLMELSQVEYITQGALQTIKKHKEHHDNSKERPDRLLPSDRNAKNNKRGEIKMFDSSVIAAIRMGREHQNEDKDQLLPSFISAISPKQHKMSRFEESFSDAVSRRRASTTQQNSTQENDQKKGCSESRGR
jgi:hypothetical protein